MHTVSLNIRLVPKGFAAVTDPRRIPARAVPFVWSEHERTWRSVEPLFVSAAKREGEGAYRAVSDLADGPFYHIALRIGGSSEDNAQTLQNRLDAELLHLVAPQRWSCLDCQRGFKKEKGAGPCARHQKEMPPAVLYKTTHPRVNRLGQYYVFGWASDYESTTPIAEHNDETWSPTVEAAAAEYEALRDADRLAAEQRAQEQAASAALSPAEKQAAFERALFGQRWIAEIFMNGENERFEATNQADAQAWVIRFAESELGGTFSDFRAAREALIDFERVAWASVSAEEANAPACPECGNIGGWDKENRECSPCGHTLSITTTWDPAPEFTPEQRAAIADFIGGNAVDWVAADADNGNADLSGVQYLYGAFGYEDQLIDDLGLDELPEGWPTARPTADEALSQARTLISAGSLMTCDESDEIELLYAAFGRGREAADMLKDHLHADARPGRCFGLADDMTIADIATATAEERGFSGAVEHQRRIIELFRAGAISDGETYSPPNYERDGEGGNE